MELYAGDCPLEDTGQCWTEQHYTSALYALPQLRTLYFVGACIGVRRSFGR